MARVTYTEVNAIGGFKATAAEMGPFVSLANSILPEDDIAEADRKHMELLLAAHLFASMIEPPTQSEKGGEVSVTYAQVVRDGFGGTAWGQMYESLLRKQKGVSVKIL